MNIDRQHIDTQASSFSQLEDDIHIPWVYESIYITTGRIRKLLQEREQNWVNTYFVRHGQTDRNKTWAMNPWDVDSELNKTWIQQAINAWKILAESNKPLDVVYSSDLQRAIKTWNYIWEQVTQFHQKQIEYFEHPDLKEMLAWRLKNYSHAELIKEFETKSTAELRKAYKRKENNWVESLEEFELRVTRAFHDLLANNMQDNILFVWHSWTSRVLKRIIEGINMDQAHHHVSTLPNSVVFELSSKRKQMLSLVD